MARSKKSPVRAIADYARRTTRNGEAVVDFLLDVMNGECEGSTPRDQIEAAKVLLERGFGKSPLTVEVTGQVTHVFAVPGFDPTKLGDADLAAMEAMLERAQVPELGAGSGALAEMEDAEVVEEPALPRRTYRPVRPAASQEPGPAREDRPWRRRAPEPGDDP